MLLPERGCHEKETWLSYAELLQFFLEQLVATTPNKGFFIAKDREWNLELLKGPAAQSLKTAMLECRPCVRCHEDVETWLALALRCRKKHL